MGLMQPALNRLLPLPLANLLILVQPRKLPLIRLKHLQKATYLLVLTSLSLPTMPRRLPLLLTVFLLLYWLLLTASQRTFALANYFLALSRVRLRSMATGTSTFLLMATLLFRASTWNLLRVAWIRPCIPLLYSPRKKQSNLAWIEKWEEATPPHSILITSVLYENKQKM